MQENNQQPQGAQNAPQPRMSLTKEEMLTLQACSRESFYYRCIPLGVLFMGGTSILVNKGFIRGHPRFGALPKNMGAGLIAYLLGKFSYQGECRRKIMALENSPLAESMRKGKRGRELITEVSTLPALERDYSPETQEPVAPKLSESYTDSNTQEQGLDDSKRPTLDGVYTRPAGVDSSESKYTNYDDLRKKNRMEFEGKEHSKASSAPAPRSAFPAPPSQSPPGPHSSDAGRNVRRNQYGDIIED